MSNKGKPVSATERQRAFKERMRAAGFKQIALWIHQTDFEAGAKAAKSGQDPLSPPDCFSVESWQSGYMNEWRKNRAQSGEV